jgi:hypothetical protein
MARWGNPVATSHATNGDSTWNHYTCRQRTWHASSADHSACSRSLGHSTAPLRMQRRCRKGLDVAHVHRCCIRLAALGHDMLYPFICPQHLVYSKCWQYCLDTSPIHATFRAIANLLRRRPTHFTCTHSNGWGQCWGWGLSGLYQHFKGESGAAASCMPHRTERSAALTVRVGVCSDTPHPA